MRKVDMATYLDRPERYSLLPGDAPGAPSCPYGNQYRWVGYDRKREEFVRFTKSVFKRVMASVAPSPSERKGE
ncbi:hypothetical protein [Lewinella sp. W8]|uniref:hypothetical protein n=1 Tax=Lewinella sp. W8 TaxID=2528208 RepID=UPI001067FED4|nr:hypothetical protein [Lewinella sp. W8]MTB49411.1 hypothetical protein [Lewinella sp. W8]